MKSAPITIEGIIDIHPRGFGFVEVSGSDKDEPDVYITRENLNGAIHGDRVVVQMLSGGEKPSGRVTEITHRHLKNIVGTLMKSKTGYFMIPDNERLGDHFEVSLSHINLNNVGRKVVAKFAADGQTVELTELLGDEDEVGVDILSIIRAYNLYEEFPKAVESEAKEVVTEITAEDIEGRLDLRGKTIITIDPVDAKDLDDAVHLEKLANGMWELGVHIADVSHYVREGGELDREAYDRGTSVYFPDRVLPMLPRCLSNDVCSLNPNMDRLTLSCIMTIDPNGEVVDHMVCETVININKRFAYEEVQELLELLPGVALRSEDRSLNKTQKENKSTPQQAKQLLKQFGPMIMEMAKLTSVLERVREARGEVKFDVPEPKIVLDEKTGKIRDVVAREHKLSHRIVETFMVLANEVVAKKMFDLDMPFIYRIHEKPDTQKVSVFVETLKPFAVQHKINTDNITGHAYQKMLDGLKPEIKPIVSQLALRSMQKAKYCADNIGHFGLGAKHYCHFTSPIRRYPDLVIHRVIKMMSNRRLSSHKIAAMKDFCIDAAKQSSAREVAATEAEREVDDLKRAEYMSDKIGETFTGTISGIRDFGVFVYLPNTCEGLVRIENMPRDSYTYNDKQMTLVGKKRTFKMGDKLDVIVASVSIARRKVEFSAS